MLREGTKCVESKLYYPIIKAAVLNNVVHHEDTGLNLWRRTNLYLDIQMQIVCINISTSCEVSWGHADKPACWGQPSAESLSQEEH